MCGEFGEVTVIIGLVINFLAFGTPFVSFRDTLSYARLIVPSSREVSRRAAESEREVSTTLSPPLNLHLTVSPSQSQVL